jgi:hypothetical protein
MIKIGVGVAVTASNSKPARSQEPVFGLGALPACEHAQHGQVDHLGEVRLGAVGGDQLEGQPALRGAA